MRALSMSHQEDGSAFSDEEMLEFLRNLMIAGRAGHDRRHTHVVRKLTCLQKRALRLLTSDGRYPQWTMDVYLLLLLLSLQHAHM